MGRKMKRVAVVGGGLSGAGAIRALKEEGIEPVCYEKSPYIGGTWCYREDVVEGIPSTMSTTIINHSKEMGAYSCYPLPDEAPNYLRHWELYSYFIKMGEDFDLFRHITCNREVIRVERAKDYEQSGNWTVIVKNTVNGEVTSEEYEGVILCTGHITYPKDVSYPGMETFQGNLLHTHDLKTVEMFSGKRVVVVGTGCSALDAAAAISNVARQVYLSIKTPSWIIPRVGPYGVPIDYLILRRHFVFLQKILPIEWVSSLFEKFVIDIKFSHKLAGLKPQYPFLCRDPIVNDDIPSRLLSGSVQLKNDVVAFKENGVLFEEDEEVTKADAVILATGYTWKFPYLEEGIIEVEGDKIKLYKCMFPPNLKHHTLSIIGFILPFGPGFPIGEIQCRWTARLFSGQCSLPSREVMLEDVDRRYRENSKRYSPSEKMSIRVDFVQFMDELASQFGVKPNFWKMLFTDPVLFRACIFGPCVPYQYRLVGPHKWEGARQAILTAPKRMKAPLQKHLKKKKYINTKKNVFAYGVALCMMALLLTLKNCSAKYYLLVLLIPYYATIKPFIWRFFLALLLMPFFIPWNGFVGDYLVTVFCPLLISFVFST